MQQTPRGVSSVISVILLVAIVVILGTTVSVFALSLGEDVSDTGPDTTFRITYDNLDDDVEKNDTIRITHVAGEVLDRERLEIVVGDDVVYNETADSESTNSTFLVPGLLVEVDADEFNDLNKPCYVDGNRVSPKGTCGGPPGDGDGSDNGVVLQWAEEVSAGETIVIQERNATEAVDVIEPGQEVQILYRGDGFSALLTTDRVPERE